MIKKQLLQLILCALALVFIATMTHAYSIPLGSQAGAINTDMPINVGSADQVKSGGLTVGTFQAQGNSYFAQTVLFNGLIRGGSTAAAKPVAFGGPANKVDVLFTGGVAIDGTYQSDTLKTGGGKKPLCADGNGTLYICGATPPTPPSPPANIIAYGAIQQFQSGPFVVGRLTQSVSKDVHIFVSATYSSPSAFLDTVKNFYTAHAVTQGTCRLNATPTALGELIVYAGTINSSAVAGANSSIAVPANCNPDQMNLIVTSTNPTSADGKTIIH
jgi:hypothetical protein